MEESLFAHEPFIPHFLRAWHQSILEFESLHVKTVVCCKFSVLLMSLGVDQPIHASLLEKNLSYSQVGSVANCDLAYSK